MSKKNVESLLTRLIKESDKKSPESKSIRRLINKRDHFYELRFKELVTEVYNQIMGTYGKKGIKVLELTNEQKLIIIKACRNYFNSVKRTMTVSSGSFTVDVLADSAYYFQVKISSPKINDNFESFINKNRQGPLEALKQELLKELQPTYTLDDISDRLQKILETGHRVGSSIAEQRVKLYLKSLDLQIKNFKSKLPDGVSYEGTPMYRLEMEINNKDHHFNSVRQIITVSDVYVSEQGRGSNYKQSIQEAIILNSIRGVLKRSLLEEDWAQFEASTPPIKRIKNALLETAKESGAKVKVSTQNKKPTKKASVSIKGKSRSTSSSESVNSVDMGLKQSNTKGAPKNWSSILQLLNRKLPLKVAENMRFPALQYRTGRFADSAKIVGVETTKEGLPSFVFDYSRDPYNVFDRTLGKSPWNTPNRDPRTLVEKSVRELVKELAISRFYTRRA